MGSVARGEFVAPGILERPAPARLGYVDGLRALTALEVVACHIGMTIWPAWSVKQTPGIVVAMARVSSYGRVAVAIFIVLSGYSLMLSVVRHGGRLGAAYGGALGFYWRRARRILPPYYFAMTFSLALITLAIGQSTNTVWDFSLPVTWQAIWQHLLLVQDFSMGRGNCLINYVFWSIAVECQIYLLFPLLVLLWRRYHPLLSAAITLTAGFTLTGALLYTWVGRIPSYGVTAVTPQFLGLFGLGMLAASLTTGPRASSSMLRRISALRIWQALALICFSVTARYTPTVSLALLDYVTGLGALALLLAANQTGSLLRRALEWRPLVWIGGFSYSLYLIHAPLIQVLWQYVFHPLGLGDTVTYLLLLLIGGPLIVLAAWGFWYVCERPFLNSRVSTARVQRAREDLQSAAV